jgi:glycosylphosphatidylinositol transamidase
VTTSDQLLTPATKRRLMERLKRLLKTAPDANVKRIQRQKAFVALLSRRLPFIRIALFTIGYLWMFLLPAPRLSRGTYIDENALQPGQVRLFRPSALRNIKLD